MVPRSHIIIMSIILNSLVSHSRNSCWKDISEEMFKAEVVVLAKVKNVSSDSEIQIRISKVIKDREERQIIKPKKKMIVTQRLGACRHQIKPNKKYIFVLSSTDSGWEVLVRPLRPSRKIKKISQNLFCERCGEGPIIRSVAEDKGVKLYR